MKAHELTRRDFLRLSAIGTVGAILAACAPAATPAPAVPAKEETPAAPPTEKVSKYNEAPMLAERVKAGQLPPVDERLPANPLVVTGRDAIGKYGGTVRQIHPDPNSFVSNYGWMAERPLGYSDLDLKTLYANSFESWEVNEDATEFTIKLRAGMKWSDGAPLTTEDVRFWYEDFLMNPDLTPTLEVQYQRGDQPMKIEVIDDYTFKVIFAAPYGDFPARLTRQETPRFFMPSHYLKQFHAKYRPKEELDAAVKEAGFETWVQLFNSHNWWVTWAANYEIGYPSLQPWIITERPAPGVLVMERNPYYWKVDEAGNQLPYIDRLTIDLVPNPETITLKIIQGELDYVGPHEVSVARYPLYKEHEPNQNYMVADLVSCMTDRYIILPNHTHKDPVMREIVNHPNWVKALSVAINRDEINENLYFGLAKMGQANVMPGSKYYMEEVSQAWAQYDPDLANKLLDEMGLDKRDAEGYRLRPDGQRLKYHIEHAGIRVGVATAEFAELVTAMWREVGIDASSEELSEQLWWERVQNNEPDLWIWHNDRCTDLLFPIDPSFFMPIQTWHGHATLWSRWYETKGKQGEEPPDYIKERYEIYERMKATPSEDERVELGKKLLKMHAERPLVIGVVLECPAPLIYNKKLRNLPKPKMPIGWDTWCDSVYHPEAYYYEA
jgi:peptide/nickel transport system substrate-binding protein